MNRFTKRATLRRRRRCVRCEESRSFAGSWCHLPASWVAGDFYDLLEHEDGRLVIIADVAGKGMAASLVMATAKATAAFLAASGSAADIARRMNDRLHGRIGTRRFVAAAVAVYDPAPERSSSPTPGCRTLT